MVVEKERDGPKPRPPKHVQVGVQVGVDRVGGDDVAKCALRDDRFGAYSVVDRDVLEKDLFDGHGADEDASGERRLLSPLYWR